eukprot:jgi/Bigna1/134087/aug1.23_g8795
MTSILLDPALDDCQQRILRDFADEKFDERTYMEKVMGSGGASELLDNLTVIIQNISCKIHSHVGSQHSQILSQAERIRDIDKHLENVKRRVVDLSHIFKVSKQRVIKPYKELKHKVAQLEFLQIANRLSVQTLRVVTKSHKLRSQLRVMEEASRAKVVGSTVGRESVKAARLIRDVNEVFDETDLSGIDVVEHLKPLITTATKRVSQLSKERFIKAVKALNQSEIGSFLQCFYFLGDLHDQVDKAVVNITSKAVIRVREALDVSRIGDMSKVQQQQQQSGSSSSSTIVSSKDGGGKVHPTSNSLPTSRQNDKNTASSLSSTTTTTSSSSSSSSMGGALRSALWKRLDVALQGLFDAGVAVYNLQQVLIKKRDSTSYESFFHVYLRSKLSAGGGGVEDEKTSRRPSAAATSSIAHPNKNDGKHHTKKNNNIISSSHSSSSSLVKRFWDSMIKAR